MSKNFPSGSLVMRVWRFDGGTELIGKFAYFDHAKKFAGSMFDEDMELGRITVDKPDWFYLAVCDDECSAKAFGVRVEAAREARS